MVTKSLGITNQLIKIHMPKMDVHKFDESVHLSTIH